MIIRNLGVRLANPVGNQRRAPRQVMQMHLLVGGVERLDHGDKLRVLDAGPRNRLNWHAVPVQPILPMLRPRKGTCDLLLYTSVNLRAEREPKRRREKHS